jgi:hypothetical protein
MTPLRQRMTEDMQVRNLSPRTQATCILQVSLFARHFHRAPEALSINLSCGVNGFPRTRIQGSSARQGMRLPMRQPRCPSWTP